MKSIKISLVTALLVGTSAFAIENTEVSGDANVFYHTSDDNSGDLFNKDDSAADASLNLAITSDLVENDTVKLSGKVGYTMISTLGLENNFVSNVWGSSHSATTDTEANFLSGIGGAKVENASWMNEAYITLEGKATKTSLNLGRMELDTPLAFTETWSIEKNSFEAAVVANQDIPDTTIVGAYIGNGNGNETFGQDTDGTVSNAGLAVGGVVNEDGTFNTFGSDGAYALGVVNNSFEPLTVQAWYYNISKLLTAYWLQADLNCKMVPGLMAGVQYSGHDIDTTDKKAGLGASGNAVEVDSDVYAAMLGYEMKDVATVKIAYSQVGEDYAAGFNAATASGTAQSKLYTEASFLNYGYVTAADTSAMKLSAESAVNGIFDLGFHYVQSTTTNNGEDTDMRDLALTASKTFGPLATTLAFINYEADDKNDGDAVNNIQAYLTLNF